MSIRSNRTDDSYASAVRRDLSQLKTTALEASRLDNLDASVRPEGAEAAAAYDSLAPHEQSAASLGVHPDALVGGHERRCGGAGRRRTIWQARSGAPRARTCTPLRSGTSP